ncbi:MAG TPA: thiamine pyrophosphate-binding protein [Burkholderiales bacterium]|jgi:thiamine pyrophosphate-dependent acetolactate synthase large subunit-like protein|nr:thiamine pyrophosphate-binding protein [Burkholderiales bacterium]
MERRDFLKGAASIGAATAVVAQAAETKKAEKLLPGDIVIERPGSDFMVDVIKTLGFEYVATNPGSSFRSLHESLVNYGGNTKPELLTCLHEESAVGMAHGYAKASGKPMAVMVHGTVGLQHAAMGIYNAWCDRVPVYIIAGNGLDANKRRPGTEWNHSVQDAALMVRDYVKWDDYPMSLQHFAESAVRAYKIATTPPCEPVMIVADIDLQEDAIHAEGLKIPKLAHSRPPQGDRAALAEAAKWLANAEAPVIIADRMARDQQGVRALVALAEALQAPVVDLGGRMNFPTPHYLCHNDRRRELVREADVVLLLEVGDPWGQFNTFSDPHKRQNWAARKDVRIISISMQDVYIRANYQDFQRYQAVDLSINGDGQTSLAMLTEEVKRIGNIGAARGEKLRATHNTMRERVREAAAVGWDASPVTTARLSAELWGAIRNEPWSLVVSDRVTWARRLWPMTEYHHALGGSGGQGVGYAAPGALGAALANKAKGLISVTFQPDGDLLYAPGVLWTAAYHKIPLLFLMHNNRGYYQEVMHLQRMASLHKRRVDTAWVGNIIDNPAIDFAKLAQSHGVWAEGPITDAKSIGPALQRALKVVKGGAPALVDVVCQPR